MLPSRRDQSILIVSKVADVELSKLIKEQLLHFLNYYGFCMPVVFVEVSLL